ncbi:MAG TPA: beta-N-acetylhexosaminidase [Vicinamibacterales bacterium]|nr:beta-N-acetylhexosaminidase [Vicinamibacterales bacterium]
MSGRSVLILLPLVLLVGCAPKRPPLTGPSAPVDARTVLVPRPVNVELRAGEFAIAPSTTIYIDSDLFASSAQFLARHIGLALGDQALKVEISTTPPSGGIAFRRNQASTGLGGEGYAIAVRPEGAVIQAETAAGAFYAVQTLRQLLPAHWEYEAIRPPESKAPPTLLRAVDIRDQTRFGWRGAMLDVGRHFLSVDEVKRYVDLMALHKLNRLHLHLADDQGWRIEIKSWPNLAAHGGSTEVDGGPGGFYTQDQFREIVRYAADRFITIVPEIDMPGHTNAALASYPELNCDGVARQLYTGIEVGFSAFCVEKEITYKFIDDVVREIGALTPGPYFHIGGDEVKTLRAEQYNAFVERVQAIVQSHGKQMIGWDEIAPTKLLPTSIVQHWRPKTTPAEAVAKGAKVILSIADRAYLDMKYDASTPIGLMWAATIDVKSSYDWDPAKAASGVGEEALLGVEAPIWSETVANIRDLEFLAFPRLAAIAEVGWSRQDDRTWSDFRVRLGNQGPRWTALGINFYRAPEIPWR